MKIVLYSWPFSPSIGGLERLTEMTATYAAWAGHQVTVVTATLDPENQSPPFPFQVERRPRWSRLAELVRRADVVQLNTFSTKVAMLALGSRRPTVWQHIDFDTVSPRGICHADGRPCRFSIRRCYSCLRRDHTLLGTARSMLSLFAKRAAAPLVSANLVSTKYASQRMPLPRSEYLSFGIDTEHWVPVRNKPQSELRLLFYGRHVPAKGCDVLIRAVRRCRDKGVQVLAHIAGDGPHRRVSEELARELHVDNVIRFLGFQSEGGLKGQLQNSDVVVIPTLQDEIGQFVAFEAMACGCAVVASEIGALPEHVGGVGLLFPPGDYARLADILSTLADDRALVTSLARRGRERVLADFDWKVMGERYLEVYARLARREKQLVSNKEVSPPNRELLVERGRTTTQQ